MKLITGKVYYLKDGWALVYFGRKVLTPWTATYVFLSPGRSETLHGFGSVWSIRKFLKDEMAQ